MKFKTRKVRFIWNKKLEGKKGYVADNINELKEIIASGCGDITTVTESKHDARPFKDDIGAEFRFFYKL